MKTDASTRETEEIPFKPFLDQWVKQEFKYPRKAIRRGIQGRVVVLLEVDRKGILSIKEFQEGDPILQKRVRKMFKKFPKLSPALQRAKPIEVRCLYPMVFRI